ncbi:PREDICTED: uncharacterized protein LOC105561649 [Vollenhovia emeryi]|uniref:uncharacterized protein LOC105561649 n=1 Tax=Vollenhovia emeryi TaxID=411798 RepID=UPI0005F406AD|nr:PREDICTED: uncharacterized protein LOC105561649 [Vollenhovia emeryi]XP_011867205.1 PREDICTED: uncharacterized protein LOC105561649 [Vollenhovia emeryi]XP_011867206.1 PREDICTED: uncharacterized protein LOC105561649 [Vollenhovia emeryi]XP_011867207.1 PREDICTED: uncharacterized protein LOC105561649 [Vollenhovia emeryi]
MMSSRENQSSEDIDKYTRDATERYELAEARNAVKHMECFVKNFKHIVDQNSAKPGDYDKWTDKEKYEHVIDNLNTYAPSVPDSLLFLISGALHRGDCNRNSTDKPLWLDMEKFQRGQKFAQGHMFSILFANVLSPLLVYAFPEAFKPLILSQKSHTPYLAFKRYNFCRGSLQEVKERSHDFIEFGLKPYWRQATPEWEHMMRCLMEFFNSNSSAFQMLLLLFADLLNIDMPRLRKTLSYSERFYLILQRFIFRYAMKLRFVREYMNEWACKFLEKAVNFGPEIHEKLKKKSERVLNKGRQQLYGDSN